MTKAKKTRKYAVAKRLISSRDSRLKSNQNKAQKLAAAAKQQQTQAIPRAPSQLFFTHNTALAPPYPILLDTNFFSHSIRAKLDVLPSLMDCLLASVRPCVTDCVMTELEKLGPKYRLALRTARDEKWERLSCSGLHEGGKGGYADDCIVERCQRERVWIVGTNDRELKRRLRKIPGVPIVSVARGKCVVERLPDVLGH